jgi:hypothetical protein
MNNTCIKLRDLITSRQAARETPESLSMLAAYKFGVSSEIFVYADDIKLFKLTLSTADKELLHEDLDRLKN